MEVFRLGIDYIPDWFMDRVTDLTVILHGDRNDLRSACILISGRIHVINKGDLCMLDSFGNIHYERIREDGKNSSSNPKSCF